MIDLCWNSLARSLAGAAYWHGAVTDDHGDVRSYTCRTREEDS